MVFSTMRTLIVSRPRARNSFHLIRMTRISAPSAASLALPRHATHPEAEVRPAPAAFYNPHRLCVNQPIENAFDEF